MKLIENIYNAYESGQISNDEATALLTVLEEKHLIIH